MATAATAATNTTTEPAKAVREAGIGVRELADKLGTDPRVLRKFLRTQEAGVGTGKRYTWPSLNDPAVKSIVSAWATAHAEAE